MEKVDTILQGLNLIKPTMENSLNKCLRPGCDTYLEPHEGTICKECRERYDSRKRMPQKLASVHFNAPDFKYLNDIMPIIKKCEMFFLKKCSYYLYGNQGTGKTWIAAAAMNYGLKMFNECFWFDWVDDVIYAKKQYPSESQADVDERVITEIVRPNGLSTRYIFIDDLGTDPDIKSDRSRMMLYRILNAAEQRNKIYFFFTTNKKLDYFAEMDGRIADRIVGCCTKEDGYKGFIELKGESLRDKTRRVEQEL